MSRKKTYLKLSATFSVQLTPYQLSALKEMAQGVGDGDGGAASVIRMAVNNLADTNPKFAEILTRHRDAAIAAERNEATPVEHVVEVVLKEKEEVSAPIVEFE